MKILAINGSPRGSRSQTLRLVQAVLDGARSAGADVEVVDVCKLQIEYCNGCTVCYERGECVKEDDFAALYEKMLESDGIVFGSPNYINSVTAQIKTLLDRMADAIHCQMFIGKYGCAVATAGGSGADEVVAYLNGVLQTLGANTVGGVGVVLGGDPEAIVPAEGRAYELGRRLVRAIAKKEIYPEQEKLHAEMLERMRALIMANKDRWHHEYDYWKAAGRIPE
ncbi:MAG: NAD(P)H-dependent oxidoreductase [Methanoculleus sp.]|nr:NAD(P)H-dependent oxidoreductase [Methanoculleus sp.]